MKVKNVDRKRRIKFTKFNFEVEMTITATLRILLLVCSTLDKTMTKHNYLSVRRVQFK